MSKLPLTEEIDFHYLLSLMMPLEDNEQFAWLPELFSIIDIDALLLLCKYAGGETIKVPTLDQMDKCVTSLQWFYDVDIKHSKSITDMPDEFVSNYCIIKKVYDASNSER